MPEDKDEVGLTINARKRKLRRTDFDSLADNLKISEPTRQRIYKRFANKLEGAKEWIDISFLPTEMKSEYKAILESNWKKMELN